MSERIFLDCPFKDKDEVKRLGAYWDNESKSWYVPKKVKDLKVFAKWLKQNPDIYEKSSSTPKAASSAPSSSTSTVTKGLPSNSRVTNEYITPPTGTAPTIPLPPRVSGNDGKFKLVNGNLRKRTSDETTGSAKRTRDELTPEISSPGTLLSPAERIERRRLSELAAVKRSKTFAQGGGGSTNKTRKSASGLFNRDLPITPQLFY